MKLPLLVRTIQYYTFILCLLSFSIAASAQELTKTEIIQIRKIQQLLLTSPKQAYAEALKLKQSKKGLASDCGDYYVACSFYAENQYAKSKILLQKLLVEIDQNPVLNQQKGYQDLMGMCVNKLFYIYKNLGEYNQALDLLQAYKQKIPSDRYQQQFGIIKIAMGNYAEGIELLKLDLHNSKHLKLGVAEKKAMNDKLFADKNNEIGEAYQKYYLKDPQKKFLDSADVYFNRAASLMFKDHFQTDFTQALLYMHKAKSAALKGDYASALAYYQKRNDYPQIATNLRTVQIFDLGMADCYLHEQNTDSAVYYAKAFIKNYQITQVSKENLLIAYSILSQSYSRQNKLNLAYEYAQKSLKLIDELNAIKNKSVDFLHNYDIKSIQSESDAILTARNHLKWILLGLSVLFLGLLFSFYFYYKKQKEKHQRFLAIIQRLKETKQQTITEVPVDLSENPQLLSKFLDAELIDKIQNGLLRLEAKEAYLKSDFKLAFVAKKLNTNTSYLSQYFNHIRLKSFSDYTQELRIDYVLRKLQESQQFRNFTLQAIAEEVGYKDANTFVRVFKKQTGLSPNYYIENLQKQESSI